MVLVQVIPLLSYKMIIISIGYIYNSIQKYVYTSVCLYFLKHTLNYINHKLPFFL